MAEYHGIAAFLALSDRLTSGLFQLTVLFHKVWKVRKLCCSLFYIFQPVLMTTCYASKPFQTILNIEWRSAAACGYFEVAEKNGHVIQVNPSGGVLCQKCGKQTTYVKHLRLKIPMLHANSHTFQKNSGSVAQRSRCFPFCRSWPLEQTSWFQNPLRSHSRPS